MNETPAADGRPRSNVRVKESPITARVPSPWTEDSWRAVARRPYNTDAW